MLNIGFVKKYIKYRPGIGGYTVLVNYQLLYQNLVQLAPSPIICVLLACILEKCYLLPLPTQGG